MVNAVYKIIPYQISDNPHKKSKLQINLLVYFSRFRNTQKVLMIRDVQMRN